MFHIEPTPGNLRNVGIIGIVFITFVLSAFLLTPLLVGLDSTIFGDAFQNTSVEADFEQGEWAKLLVVISMGGGAFLVGAYVQLLIIRLFLPRQYELTHSLIVLLDSSAMMLAILYIILFFYSQIEAVTGEERRQALVLTGLCSIFYALLVTVINLIGIVALYWAKTVPRSLSMAIIGFMILNLIICFLSLNPAWPGYRVIMGLPVVGIMPIAFTAYCFILAKAIETTEITITPATQ